MKTGAKNVKLQPAIPPAEWFDLDRGEKMRKKTWTWRDLDTDELVTKTEHDGDDRTYPLCPKCGHRPTYWEGQIDETIMGDRIEGFAYHCYPCKIGTDAVEMD